LEEERLLARRARLRQCRHIGKFGRARKPLVTASARSLPSLMSAAAEGKALNAMGVCPPIVAFIAGAPPLKGTCTMSSRTRA